MRIARRLLVVGAIAGLLFFGANIVAERIAEDRIADQAMQSFGSSKRPTVELEGFPILLSVLRGEIARASLSGTDLVVDDLRIARAHIVLEGVRAKISDITQNKPIRVARGLATAEVTTANVNAYLRSRDDSVTLTIVPGKVIAEGTVPQAGVGRAEGVPRIVGRLLVFRPDRVTVGGRPLSGPALERARAELSFELDLPELPGGIRITAIELDQGFARFIARFEARTIDLA